MDGEHPARRSRRRELTNAFGAPLPAEAPWLLQAVDLLLVLLVCGAPFLMGGRQAWGQLVIGLLACAAALCWATLQIVSHRPRVRWTGAEPLFALGLLLLVLQIVELPGDWLHTLSPALREQLPMWTADSPLGEWRTLSIVPEETRSSLLTVFACLLAFVVFVQRMQTAQDVGRLLLWQGAASAGMAAFGIIQFALGNGKFFWFYEHPYTDTEVAAKGAFTNANHFAHYIALGLPIWLSRISLLQQQFAARRKENWSYGFRGDAREQLEQWLAAGCLGVIVLGLLLSRSRGGLVIGCAGMSIVLLLLWRRALVGAGAALGVCTLGAAGIVGLVLFGGRMEAALESNLQELATTDVNEIDRDSARRHVWAAVMEGARDYPYVGAGLNAHREVYHAYYDHPETGIEYSHAENGYLQLALETGLAGLTLGGLFVLLLAGWCLAGWRRAQQVEHTAPLAAIIAIVAMNLLHSATDFIWYVPACMLAGLAAAAGAARLAGSLPVHKEEAPPPSGVWFARPMWGAFAALLIVFGFYTVQVKLPEVAAEPHWFEYLRLARSLSPEDEDDPAMVRRKLQLVTAALKANPRAARAQLAASRTYLHAFRLLQAKSDNPMPLAQLKDAARANFTDAAELQAWLDKPGVLGDRKKYLAASSASALRAVRLCPMLAGGYLQIAELAWLNQGDDALERRLIGQAVQVRPFDSRVQFTLGRYAFAEGHFEEALDHWRDAFHRDASQRGQFIAALSPVVSARFFLEHFDVDRRTLTLLRAAYHDAPDREGYAAILDALATASIDEAGRTAGAEAVACWIAAFGCYAELDDAQRAEQTIRLAVEKHPASYDARSSLGNYLFDQGRLAAASEHLDWCVRRRPDDDVLRGRAKQAHMAKVRPATQIAEDKVGERAVR